MAKVAALSGVVKVTRVAMVARLAKGGKCWKGGNVTKADLSGKICNSYQGSEGSECG